MSPKQKDIKAQVSANINFKASRKSRNQTSIKVKIKKDFFIKILNFYLQSFQAQVHTILMILFPLQENKEMIINIGSKNTVRKNKKIEKEI